MKVMWKAACAAVLLIAATTIEIGCGNVYRPIATPLPTTTGNPCGRGDRSRAVLLSEPHQPERRRPNPSSVLTDINVSGDTNTGNKVLANNVVGSTWNCTVTPRSRVR